MLEKIGYRPEMSRWTAAGDATLGRVARADRGVLLVLTERGPMRCTYGGGLLAAVAADPVGAPCPGDWCVVRHWPDGRATVELVLPRDTALARPGVPEQVLCANADLVGVVLAARPAPAAPSVPSAPSAPEVRRLVELAEHSGARPLVVLTKCDRAPDPAAVAARVAAAVPGVDVISASTATGAGLAALRHAVGGRLTLALIGPAGHGRSALTRALVGAELLPARRAGRRHDLVVLPGGGAVVDTPDVPATEVRPPHVWQLRDAGGGR